MTTRGIRRKKSTLTDLKIAVVGAPGVGKSALIVRFLTKRYIGEYDHQTENRYKHEALVDGEPILFEILDTCPKTDDEFPNASELVQWADGLLLVYSITDRNTFNYIRKAKCDLQTDTPLQLVANKVDMVHLRQLSGRGNSAMCLCMYMFVGRSIAYVTTAAQQSAWNFAFRKETNNYMLHDDRSPLQPRFGP
ncbi:ras-like protein family member 11B isoform X3 [Glossina fuscipes]|uniref:small monomeric GTPase n=1 Tax=Glossina fuscipes TaxID=7396 RepID=A0A8U0W4L7_9MUSC|nr:ras-like protein family member 11B isoform X3 [Glossina fuscipes]